MKYLLGVIVIILLVGVGVFVLSRHNPKTQNKETMKPAPTKQVMSGVMNDTLLNLVNSGKPLTCTFNYMPTGAAAESHGTVFLSGGKVRGDFKVSVTGAPEQQVHMVRDADYTYIWGSTMTTGIKIKNSVATEPTNTTSNKYVDVNQKLNYNCNSWAVDSGQFTVPTNVTFQDMTSFMVSPKSGATGSASSPNSAACAACNNLNGEQKTACLTQLKCQ